MPANMDLAQMTWGYASHEEAVLQAWEDCGRGKGWDLNNGPVWVAYIWPRYRAISPHLQERTPIVEKKTRIDTIRFHAVEMRNPRRWAGVFWAVVSETGVVVHPRNQPPEIKNAILDGWRERYQ